MNSLQKVISQYSFFLARDFSRTTVNYGYHYTASENLVKILTPKRQEGVNSAVESKVVLRLSDVTCLNDISENSEAKIQYQTVCNKLHDEDLISQDFFNLLSTVTQSDTIVIYEKEFHHADGTHETVTTGRKSSCQRFVCCFSQENDLLPMWNYYSKSSRYEGYSIGIDLLEMKEELQRFFHATYQPYIVEMIYNDEVKAQIIRNCILALYASWNEEHGKEADESVKVALSEFLWSWNLAFKNSKFVHEKEIRFVFDIPTSDIGDALNPHRGCEDIEICYLSKNGLLTPYIDISFNSSIFSSITVGPFTNSQLEMDNQRRILLSYLSHNGFCDSEIFIKFSQVPVRF